MFKNSSNILWKGKKLCYNGFVDRWFSLAITNFAFAGTFARFSLDFFNFHDFSPF